MKLLKSLPALLLCSVWAVGAQTSAELKSWLPQVDGWAVVEQVETFGPSDLFNRINGAAPLFIENNFREMTSMEYAQGDDRITIQAYRHATPEDTFGMYSSERSTDMEFFPFAGEAHGDDKSVYFYAGNIYVKMWTNSEKDVAKDLLAIASGLAGKIDPSAGYPPIAELFPETGKSPHSEAYITANYIGHEFLKGVYTVDYNIGGKKVQLFVIDVKTAEGAKDVLGKYFTFTGQPMEFGEGELTVKDRFNGDIPVVWKGRYITGAFSESGSIIQGTDELIKELSGKLASM